METVLLKNEGDFISVEQGKESSRKKKQRDENIRQLLDVTNKTTLTTEEMRDFEMKWVFLCSPIELEFFWQFDLRMIISSLAIFPEKALNVIRL